MTECYTGPTGPTGSTGNGIKYSFIDSCNQLVFIYDDGFQNTLGNVKGPTGYTGWTGPTGSIGPTGIGIQLVYLDSCCNLIIVLTDGSTLNAGNYSSCGGPTGAPSGLYYGFLTPSGTSWPIGTTPTPSSNPTVGSFYVNLNSGIMYSFNGSAWTHASSSSSGTTPIVNPEGGILFFGTDSPSGVDWPSIITPSPTGPIPIQGNVYMNEPTGNMYIYDGTDQWVNLQGGDMPKFRSYVMTVHVNPSTPSDGYGITLDNIITNDGTFSLFTSSNINTVVSLAGFTDLYQVPDGCSYLVCNVEGVYNVQMAVNSLDFTPNALPTPGDIAIYVINSGNAFTYQTVGVNICATLKLVPGDKLVIYANAISNILSYDCVNNSAYLEISRRF